MSNTLVDSALGDVTQINIPIGQETPEPGSFTKLVAQSVSVSGPVTVSGPISVAINPTVAVAATTDTFAAAVALTAAINVVVTAAFASGSPVALPSAATIIGASVAVFNQTTHTVAVWPQPGDGIDVLGTTVPALLDAGKRALFYGIAAPVGTTSLGSIISAQLGVTSV